MLDVVLHKVAEPLNIENSRYIPGMCVVTQATCRFSEEISENWASSMKGYRKIKTERAICEESYDWTALLGGVGHHVLTKAGPALEKLLRKLWQPWQWDWQRKRKWGFVGERSALPQRAGQETLEIRCKMAEVAKG